MNLTWLLIGIVIGAVLMLAAELFFAWLVTKDG